MYKRPVNFWLYAVVALILAVLVVALLIKVVKVLLFLLLVLVITPVIYTLLRYFFQPRSLNDKASKLKYRS